MKGYGAIALSLVCVLVMATPMYAADNQAGTWKLNLSKSKYDPAGLAPKSQTLKVDSVANGMKVVVDTVDSSGKPVHYEYTATFDGKDYAVKGDPNRDMTAIKKIDDFNFEATNKKGGKVTTMTRTVFSRDGKTRTITTTGTNPKGQKVNNTAVFDKQ